MYYYIVDPQTTSAKNYERVQNQLYSCLSAMRISGEIARVTSLRGVKQLVEAGVTGGATTIVAVGDDNTFEQVVAATGHKNVIVGYVPITESEVGTIIGAGTIETACQNLAQRRVEELDLGGIRPGPEQYSNPSQAPSATFFTYLSLGIDVQAVRPKSAFDFSGFKAAAALNPVQVNLSIDDMYTAQFKAVAGIIINSRADQGGGAGIANPTDHMLDVLLLPQLSAYDAWKHRGELSSGRWESIPGCAVVRGSQIRIDGPLNWPLYVGGQIMGKTPAVIEAIPNKIRMIVGRGRTF